jgi:aminoglycoside-2''-adenylyltransferase
MSTRHDSLFAIDPVISLDDAVARPANERVREVTRLGEIAKTIRGGKLEAMLESGIPSLSLEQVLVLFKQHQVECLVVGGYAIAFHGYPQFTRDLDLFYRQTLENADRILAALRAAGFTNLSRTRDDLMNPQLNYKLGRPPNQIDLNSEVKGIVWETANRAALAGEILGQPVRFIDLDTLIATKRAAGRPQDLADIDGLMRHLEEL